MPENGNAALLIKDLAEGAGLADRGYLKEYLDKPLDKDTATALLKKLDGAESLLGKRPQLPDPKTAKPEELEKLFEQYRPEKADDYEIPLAEGKKVDGDFLKVVRAAFHEGKLSKVQAAKVLAKFNEYGLAAEKAQAEAKKKADLEFDTLAKTMLGAENKPTMERVKKLIAEHAPSPAKAAIEKLDDTNLLIMTAVIDAIHKKYAPEDELNGKGGSSGSSGGQGVAEKRERAKALLAEISKLKPMDPQVEKKQAEVNQLYREIAEATA